MSTLFELDSSLISSDDLRKRQYITVSQEASDFFKVLPVLEVEIVQRADLSISKTLSGGFNYVVFEDMPVSIKIIGIYTLSQHCLITSGKTAVTEATIQELYDEYKVGNLDNKMLTVNINGVSYSGMAVSLVQESATRLAQGVMSYTLSMIGNRNG